MEERVIKVVLNLTLSEIAELYDKTGVTVFEDVFHNELEHIENLVVEEIAEKLDERTFHTLCEYFKVTDSIDHFDFSEFINKLKDIQYRKFNR